MITIRAKLRVAVLTMSMVAAGVIGISSASADSAVVVADLPSARSHTSAVWLGDAAYVFGGKTDAGSLNQVVRFTPSDGAVSVLPVTLPTAIWDSSAVTDGTSAYIFGGMSPTGPSNKILKFDPVGGTVTQMAAVLPVASSDTAAFWDGSRAYIAEGGGSRRLLRYDPGTDVLSVMSAQFPDPISGPSAAWTGSFGYIQSARFHKVDTTNGTITATASTYTGRDAAAVFHGSRMWVLGGSVNTSDLYQIQDYNPATDRRWVMTTQLPGRRGGPSAVGDGTNIYVFGGMDRGGTYQGCSPAGPVVGCPSRGRLTEIVRYVPTSGPVKNLRVLPGTSLGQNSLFWDYPDGQTFALFSYPTGFRIYRRVGVVGVPTFLVQTGVTLSYADNTCPLGQTCWYQVTMLNPEGEGEPSLLVPGVGWRP